MLSIAFSLLLLPVLAAVDAPAQSRQGGLDVSDEPKPIVLPTLLKDLVPPDCPVRDAQRTMLSPKGELIITCTRDFLADGVSTHILVTDERASVLKDIDLYDLPANYGGFNGLEATKEVIGESNQHMFVVVFSTAGDGSGSAFFVIGYKNGKYHVLLDRSVSQGRIVFHPDAGSVDIWGALYRKCPDEPLCVWCLHQYKIETYSWQSSRFRRKYSHLTKKCLDPDPIASDPIIVDKKHS